MVVDHRVRSYVNDHDVHNASLLTIFSCRQLFDGASL